MEKIQDKLMDNCTLWVIKTKGWSATDALTAEDLGKDESDIDQIFRLGRKNLIPDDWRIKLNKTRSKIPAGMKKMRAQRYIVSSIWAVPNSQLEFADMWMQTLIKEQQDIVDEFISEYDNVKKEMIGNHPALENADWPDPAVIKKAYKIEPIVFEIASTKINQADPEKLIEIKQKYAEKYEKNVKELTEVYVTKAHEQIIETCKDITSRIMEGGKKVTKTTLKKPMELIKEYEAIASMFDDEAIKDEVDKLKYLVSGTDASKIRDKGAVAEDFAKAIASISRNIGDLSGVGADGRVKRQIKLDKAA